MKSVLQSANLRGMERCYKQDLPVSIVSSIENHRSFAAGAKRSHDLAIGVLISNYAEKKKRIYDGEITETSFPLAYIELPGAETRNLNEHRSEMLYITYAAELQVIIRERFNIQSSGTWPITVNSRLVDTIKQIKRLLCDPYKRSNVDLLDFYCQTLTAELMLYRQDFTHDPQAGEIEKKMQEVHLFLYKNYKNPPTIDALGTRFGMSPRSLRRNWSKYYSESIKKFVTRRRISEAQHLLEHHSGNITQIAYEVGYEDPLYFSRVFREITGVSPSEFLPGKRK